MRADFYPMAVVQNEPDMSEAQRQLQHATRRRLCRRTERAVSFYLYQSTGLDPPTHNGIRQCAGPSLVSLGEHYGTHPRQRCCCRSCAGCTASPRRTGCCLYERKLRNPGREPRSGFSRLSVSLAEPYPHLTRVLTIILGVGARVSSKKPPLLVFPPLASPRVIFLQERARVLFDDGAAER